MPKQENVLSYARSLAESLREGLEWNPGQHGDGRGWWVIRDHQQLHTLMANAFAGMDFLRQYAGPDSFWTSRAAEVYQNKGNNQSTESGARAVGDVLLTWVGQVEAGVTDIVGARAWAEVDVISTDMMGQVRRLLEDNQTHPAAAIVLCGGALESALRAVVEGRGLELTERPSLSAYTRLLRREELITKQEAKDLEQVGGLRNAAAHGQFNELSRERAGLMEQQTNLLLSKLTDLQQ
ncbi:MULTISPECIES: hypothetical protein [unclassified Streptomyces]|uniref:hypothetical protein n=1 Tax=unclassified Streptomyces TaxID=2593676 RepID=UPI0006F549F2|nr:MULTISPECIES: hypothetical protein [unclassified Streptomyces]KQX51505.1 hypothetical protein ASD33_33465 [Streptomyces sp. Root1304]KRA85924.1 hypothetical protein ASE09_33445 [Streptomyces sp. Root66D1]